MLTKNRLDRKQILIIDDDVVFCQLVKAGLEQQEMFEVITATDPLQGLKVARRVRPDLILLDILMPKMDGLEVLRRLKEQSETVRIPVLMLTADDDEGSKRKAMSLYDDDYIEKPVPLEVLRSRITKALERKLRCT